MDLRQRYLTKNECYISGKKIKVKGLMLHSTGANNPKLGRYVDAPELKPDISPNNWNQYRPDGRQVCVHAFIGYLPNKEIATYQTLPWDHRAWGGGGSSNNTHIHVEICEASLTDSEYFNKVYKEAVELFAYLCKQFKLNPMTNIITHSEGYRQGIASNHGDVMHWFPKHGKSMGTFRTDVANAMKGGSVTPSVPSKPDNSNTPSVPNKPSVPSNSSIDQLANDVIAGKYGSGDARKKALGSKYSEVQKRVNEILSGKQPSKPVKSTDQLANEVIKGLHGSGEFRKKSLGSRYSEVQKRVNEILSGVGGSKTISQLADEVIKGLHGSGKDRMNSLGSKYAAVQKEVNSRLKK